MTGQDIVDRWRSLIGDAIKAYRYPDTVALKLLNDAIRELTGLRPDLTLDDDGTILAMADLTDLADTVTLPEDFRRVVPHLMAAYVYEDEGTDDANAKAAQAARTKFTSLI